MIINFMKNKKNIISLFILGIVMIIVIFPLLSFAQEGGNEGSGEAGNSGTNMNIKIENPFKQDTIKGLIETIVNDILMPIGGVIAVLMIMYAGFLYVTAQGDPGQITKAHDALKWAVIGAAILLGAWVISTAISTTVDQLRK